MKTFLEIVAGATPGPFEVFNDNDGMDPAYAPLWCVSNDAYHSQKDEEDRCFRAVIHYGCIEDATLIANAQRLLREREELRAALVSISCAGSAQARMPAIREANELLARIEAADSEAAKEFQG